VPPLGQVNEDFEHDKFKHILGRANDARSFSVLSRLYTLAGPSTSAPAVMLDHHALLALPVRPLNVVTSHNIAQLVRP